MGSRSLAGAVCLVGVLAGCTQSAPEGLVSSTTPMLTTGADVPTSHQIDSGLEAPLVVERPEWAAVFAAEGAVGTIAVHKIGSNRIDVFDLARAAEPQIPASTFKILNSLIILETGTLPDVDTMVPWDGVDRGVTVWNQDHSLRSGIEVSAVWLFQRMAREIGYEQMAYWVSRAQYGNADIDGGIDQFWLSGDLRISAMEQIDFLARLVEGELPFRDEVVAAVRDILVRESGDGWAWSHKTGTSLSSTPPLGWLVGIAENAGGEWVFALNLDLETVGDTATQLDPQLRQRIARAILVSEGALPE
jgi:beta-lactamase class D